MTALTRRRFLGLAAGAAAAVAGAGVDARFIELHWIEVVRRRLAIRGLPAPLRGLTLVQMSDVHVGPHVDDDYVARVFARVSAWRADLVVYTGDFITNSPRTFEKLRRLYAGAPRGRIATLGVLGNHDYGRNWSHPEIAARVTSELASLGIEVIRNDVREVAGLQIAGLDDWWAGALDADRTFARLDFRRPALALSHNPDTADLPIWHGYHGWILSGHTHGGQVRLPPFPPPVLPIANRRYAAGEVALEDGRRLYVSRGVGHLAPIRFGVRPEVTIFTMESAEDGPASRA